MGELDLDLTLSSKIPAKLARITIELTAKTSSGDKALCVQIKTAPENLIADGENLIADPSSAEDVQRSSWPHPSSSAPNKTVTTYHLFQRKYTGLANKDAGDFTGDASFIFMTFNPFEAGNPESSMQHNIIEMSTVSVEDWSTEYLKCNAPGAVYSGHGQGLDCPSSNIDYCCTGNRSALTAETLPAYEAHGGGYWFSFPKASEGKKWTEKLQRRINGSCVGNAWRKEAGGCSQCGADLDQCVASCIQSTLVKTSDHWPHTTDYTKLRSVWDKAFSDKTMCPDQPLPGDVTAIIADPASAEGVQSSSWPYPSSAPNKTVTTYHLFQRKYTGLANKDAGDFTGDASFIFTTFNPFEAGNPEASMQHNIIEMSTVTVKDWSTEYLRCNAPGAVYSGRGQGMDCPSSSPDYCCVGNRTGPITSETLPAYEGRGGGYWFSFPKASEGKKWTEKLQRRINGSC